jgi:hypothetical protein
MGLPEVRAQSVKLTRRVYPTGKTISSRTNNSAGRGNKYLRFLSKNPLLIIEPLL